MGEGWFTLLGTFIGFILSEVATWIRKGRGDRSQSKSVRAILNLEAELNLQKLSKFWARVKQLDEPDKEPHSLKHQLACQFIDVPLPPFRREAFQSQLPLLAKALREKEIVQLFGFYDRLEQLEVVRTELIIAKREQREESRAATETGGPVGKVWGFSDFPPAPFNNMATDVWDECELLVTQLLAEGNPLGQK